MDNLITGEKAYEIYTGYTEAQIRKYLEDNSDIIGEFIGKTEGQRQKAFAKMKEEMTVESQAVFLVLVIIGLQQAAILYGAVEFFGIAPGGPYRATNEDAYKGTFQKTEKIVR